MRNAITGLLVLLAASCLPLSAAAQDTPLPAKTDGQMSLADYEELLASMAMTTQTFSPSGSATLIRAELPNGNAFIVEPRGCEDPGAVRNCGMFSMFVGIEPFGVAYPQVNAFHIQHARMATVVRVGPDQGIIAGKVFTAAGMSRDATRMHVALFLQDVSRFFADYIGAQAIAKSVGLEPDYAPLFSRSLGGKRQEISYGHIIDLTGPTIGQRDVSFLTQAAKRMIEEHEEQR
jgi:hypothetical protein